MSNERIYCIIVTYNGMQWLERCLESIERSSMPMQTIVVDNASIDHSIPFIRANFPKVHIIETGRNLGFGQANNLGLREAIDQKADHVLLLNQDVYLATETVEQLVQIQRAQPVFGLLSPMHLNGAGTAFDDHFYTYLQRSDAQIFFSKLFFKEADKPAVIASPFVNAAVWLLSRECLLKTGGFDPIFFHYGEDDNYAQRVRFAGFSIGIVPAAIAMHDKNRESLSQSTNPSKIAEKAHLNFLNQVCAPQERHYQIRMLKRFVRHLSAALLSIIRGAQTDARVSWLQAKMIIQSAPEVKRSRITSTTTSIMPHLVAR